MVTVSGMKLFRRNLLAGVSASLLAIFGQAEAVAAAGPTITCTRVGQKAVFRGYRYSCIKSKGKLVWKRGAKVATPSASTSTEPNGPQVPPALVFMAKASEVVENETKFFVVIKTDRVISYPVLATRINGAVVVLSAICTHRGCIVHAEKGRIICPCHESSFNAMTGNAIKGSVATKALRKYVVSEDADSIFIEL